MAVDDTTEELAPVQIAEGDVILDELGRRRITVTAIHVDGNPPDASGDGRDARVFSFFGDSPHDRASFAASERVQRVTPSRL